MRTIPCLYAGNEVLCPYRNKIDSCKQTCHHLFYPRTQYTTPLQRSWRNHCEHKVKICAGLHEALHQTQLLPTVPPNYMIKEKLGDKAEKD